MLVLVAMTGALAMVMLDQTIVTVALPTMMRDIPLSPGGAHWVASIYVLSMAALVALGGRIGDWLGPTTTCRIGVLLFFIASCGCGLVPHGSWGESFLLACRALQGAGAALMLPASQAMVANAFPLESRGRAMALYVGIGQIFLAIGPLLGGVLTEFVSWRSVFWLNVPVGLATLVLIAIARPDDKADASQRPPLWPALMLVFGMGLFVLGVQEGPGFGWTSPITLGAIAIGATVLALWLRQQWHAKAPLIDLRQAIQPGIAGDLVVLGLIQFALLAVVLYGALYLQNVLGASPIAAGAMALPLILGIAIGAQLGGRLYDRFGIRLPALTGLLLASAGTAAWALALLDGTYLIQVPCMVVAGLGAGLVQSPTGTDALNRAPAEKRTEISGLTQTMRQLGGTLGLAAIGAVVLSLEPTGTQSVAARVPIAAGFAASALVLLLGAMLAWFWLARERVTGTNGADAG